MTCKVAIDLALDRFFDYEVPEALKEKLAVGQLLSVPFGHREARGFVMEIGECATGFAGAAPHRLKPIGAIVDETPFFSSALLTLVKKVAAYTTAPIESVLKAALPAAVLKKNMRPRELMYVEATLGGFMAGEVRVTRRQQWLLDQMVRLGGGWMAQLCRELKTTPATIRELGRLGLVKVSVRERRRSPLGAKRILPTKPLPLNAEQQAALSAIRQLDAANGRTILLHGVTGSGKTEVYLQAIARELEAGRGAIVMVPEISLTPQTVQRFASRFGERVAVLHSALSDGERYDEWHRIRSGEARVVVGPRSAVWAPVKNLGLIVVDEEHETSYKQDESPRYHARDVAVLRGAVENARVVLGSATPSLETWENAVRGKYALSEMRHRAGLGTLPAIRIVEMRGGSIFSPELLQSIRLRLDRHEQVILFLNRRGYSRQVSCDDCHHVIECPECGLPYTYHLADSCLRCHICGGWEDLPRECPACHGARLTYKGVGTQRAEAALAKCFPTASVLRMDADSTSRKHSHDDILGAFRRGEADVLLGTQMIAKGLDFPNVTLVGVLNADSSINMPDFRAVERSFQLFAQVAGRAGRAELPGEVVIQTYDPESQVLDAVVRGDFAAFAAAELQVRKEGFFPPYCHLAVINIRSQNPKEAADWADLYSKSLAKCAAKLDNGRFEVSEAMPSALEKAEGWYRWQVVLRAVRVSSLARSWKWISQVRPWPRTVRASIDIDAYNLI